MEEKKYSKDLLKEVLSNHLSPEYLDEMFKKMDELENFPRVRPVLNLESFTWFLDQTYHNLGLLKQKDPLSFYKDMSYVLWRMAFYIALESLETRLSEGLWCEEGTQELVDFYTNIKI